MFYQKLNSKLLFFIFLVIKNCLYLFYSYTLIILIEIVYRRVQFAFVDFNDLLKLSHNERGFFYG